MRIGNQTALPPNLNVTEKDGTGGGVWGAMSALSHRASPSNPPDFLSPLPPLAALACPPGPLPLTHLPPRPRPSPFCPSCRVTPPPAIRAGRPVLAVWGGVGWSPSEAEGGPALHLCLGLDAAGPL